MTSLLAIVTFLNHETSFCCTKTLFLQYALFGTLLTLPGQENVYIYIKTHLRKREDFFKSLVFSWYLEYFATD